MHWTGLQGEPRSKAVGRLVVLLTLLAAALTGCSSRPVATACGGQCTSPYELDVQFRSATTTTEARAALQRCSHEATVVRVDVVPAGGHGVAGRVFTTAFGRNPSTQPLLDCLSRRPEIDGRGWPG
jgi:hypothetical protein